MEHGPRGEADHDGTKRNGAFTIDDDAERNRHADNGRFYRPIAIRVRKVVPCEESF